MPLTAATRSSEEADPLTSAEPGIETFAEETPSTFTSAACTCLTQPTPHVMPETFSETVCISPESAVGAESEEGATSVVDSDLQAVRDRARPARPLRRSWVDFIINGQKRLRLHTKAQFVTHGDSLFIVKIFNVCSLSPTCRKDIFSLS